MEKGVWEKKSLNVNADPISLKMIGLHILHELKIVTIGISGLTTIRKSQACFFMTFALDNRHKEM